MDRKTLEKQMKLYLNGEMSEPEKVAFENLLADMEIAVEDLPEMHRTAKALHTRRRPSPPPELLQNYQQELKTTFADPPLFLRWRKRMGELWRALVIQPSPALRFAEVAFLMIIGIYVGRSLLQTPAVVVVEDSYNNSGMFYPNLRGVSEANRDQIREMLFGSEQLLLEIINAGDGEDFDEVEWELNRELADELLKIVVPMQQRAIQLNHPETLRFLSKMEIFLYDVANMESEEVAEALPFLKELVLETSLHLEVRRLMDFYKEETPADLSV